MSQGLWPRSLTHGWINAVSRNENVDLATVYSTSNIISLISPQPQLLQALVKKDFRFSSQPNCPSPGSLRNLSSLCVRWLLYEAAAVAGLPLVKLVKVRVPSLVLEGAQRMARGSFMNGYIRLKTKEKDQ